MNRLRKLPGGRYVAWQQSSKPGAGACASFSRRLRLMVCNAHGLSPVSLPHNQEQTMPQTSAVDFATTSRIHIALAVKDVEESIAFYRTLFGQEPTKKRLRYAKFEVAEPPVNLALNDVGGATGPSNPVAHFGIQVKSSEAVQAAAARLRSAGLLDSVEDNVTCCYALQSKVWAIDPDGNKWEVYVLLDDDGAHHHASAETCCTPAATVGQASNLPASGRCCASEKLETCCA
jgi:catechol 2,3-dioxygenase-like lactoylglutathione lyase family enzyme